MSEECLDEVNERTSYVITVSFKDEDGQPVVPDEVGYRIDRPALRINVLPFTLLGSFSSSIDILITMEQNRIYRQRNASEIQEVTVEFDYNSGTFGFMHGTNKYRYRVVNLYGVQPVASASISPSSSPSPSI